MGIEEVGREGKGDGRSQDRLAARVKSPFDLRQREKEGRKGGRLTCSSSTVCTSKLNVQASLTVGVGRESLTRSGREVVLLLRRGSFSRDGSCIKRTQARTYEQLVTPTRNKK